jgi:hypothetical protein
MPYIKGRELVDEDLDLLISKISYHVPEGDEAGFLNYSITKLILGVYQAKYGDPRYKHINSIMGVLECCKQEIYRRVAVSYEDIAKRKNNDLPEFQEWGEL